MNKRLWSVRYLGDAKRQVRRDEEIYRDEYVTLTVLAVNVMHALEVAVREADVQPDSIVYIRPSTMRIVGL